MRCHQGEAKPAEDGSVSRTSVVSLDKQPSPAPAATTKPVKRVNIAEKRVVIADKSDSSHQITVSRGQDEFRRLVCFEDAYIFTRFYILTFWKYMYLIHAFDVRCFKN